MIASVNSGLIKRCAYAVSKDLQQSEQLEDKEYCFAKAAEEWVRR